MMLLLKHQGKKYFSAQEGSRPCGFGQDFLMFKFSTSIFCPCDLDMQRTGTI